MRDNQPAFTYDRARIAFADIHPPQNARPPWRPGLPQRWPAINSVASETEKLRPVSRMHRIDSGSSLLLAHYHTHVNILGKDGLVGVNGDYIRATLERLPTLLSDVKLVVSRGVVRRGAGKHP